nr:hypothetical protein [Methanobrevibacter arboriphilus]
MIKEKIKKAAMSNKSEDKQIALYNGQNFNGKPVLGNYPNTHAFYCGKNNEIDLWLAIRKINKKYIFTLYKHSKENKFEAIGININSETNLDMHNTKRNNSIMDNFKEIGFNSEKASKCLSDLGAYINKNNNLFINFEDIKDPSLLPPKYIFKMVLKKISLVLNL